VVVQRLVADQDRPVRRIMAAEQGGPGPRPIAGLALAECPPELHRQGAILVPVDGARQGQDLAAQDHLLDETACRLGQPEMKDQIGARRRLRPARGAGCAPRAAPLSGNAIDYLRRECGNSIICSLWLAKCQGP
jgi:hypothetical protein